MRYIFRVPEFFRNIFRAFRREKYRKIPEREKYIHIAREIQAITSLSSIQKIFQFYIKMTLTKNPIQLYSQYKVYYPTYITYNLKYQKTWVEENKKLKIRKKKNFRMHIALKRSFHFLMKRVFTRCGLPYRSGIISLLITDSFWCNAISDCIGTV